MENGLKKIYSEIPERYELVNHIMTLGLDKLWRRRAATIAAEGGGERWLDICSGTGEMAAGLTGLAPTDSKIFATDYSMSMLARARRKRGMERVGLAISDALSLPYADSTFDLVTCSFAMRNLNSSRDDLLEVLREVRRVLKDGGRFMNLETSRPGGAFVRSIFHTYVRLFVKPVGSAITGSRAGYGYLAGSIRRFYGAAELEELLLDAGYRGVASKRMMLGAVAIHLAVR
jgi:demethylmenaquinone methyltransferase/2-methoxy-6-polyprenyl-1,4-benzoquinol methylase